ncbi:MAG TPA: pyroglutamyl-peptidase I [Jatrophihabitans sp.]
MTRVLMTAFEPFGGEQVNPSQLAVQRLVDAGPDGVELRSALLPVVYYEARDALRAAIEQYEPDLVICTGQAGGRYGVTPEKVAVNRNDTTMPDNAGQAPLDEPIVTDGPAAYFTGLPVAEIVAALRAAAIPSEVSWTAGAYVCNHVFYSLMHLLATERPGLRGGFIHVPYAHEQVLERAEAQPSLALESIADALRIAVSTTLQVGMVATAG